MFINPDLTLYIEREPIGEWICLQARTIIAPDGIATAESVLYDQQRPCRNRDAGAARRAALAPCRAAPARPAAPAPRADRRLAATSVGTP